MFFQQFFISAVISAVLFGLAAERPALDEEAQLRIKVNQEINELKRLLGNLPESLEAIEAAESNHLELLEGVFQKLKDQTTNVKNLIENEAQLVALEFKHEMKRLEEETKSWFQKFKGKLVAAIGNVNATQINGNETTILQQALKLEEKQQNVTMIHNRIDAVMNQIKTYMTVWQRRGYGSDNLLLIHKGLIEIARERDLIHQLIDTEDIWMDLEFTDQLKVLDTQIVLLVAQANKIIKQQM